MRRFEKISFEQYQKDVNADYSFYISYSLPARSTSFSAGYDFVSLEDFVLQPLESRKIPTGIKACMEQDEVLLLLVRSSMGFKNNIRMCNQVGVIDQDYYNNINNEGHIWIKLQNEGDVPYEVKQGDRIAQGIFTKFLIVDNEEKIESNRTGGIGSTNKEMIL